MKSVAAVILCLLLTLSLASCALFDANDAAFGGTQSEDPKIMLPVDTGVVDNYYVGSGFKFVIPEKWVGHLASDLTSTEVDGVPTISRRFYYVDSNGVNALLIRICAFTAENYKKLSLDPSFLLLTGSDGTAYVRMPFTSDLPTSFASAETFDILYAFVNSASFTLTAN